MPNFPIRNKIECFIAFPFVVLSCTLRIKISHSRFDFHFYLIFIFQWPHLLVTEIQ